MHYYHYLVYIIGAIHLAWGAIILVSGGIPQSTTLAPLSRIFVYPFGALALFAASGCAFMALRWKPRVAMLLLTIPQQFFLALSSYGAFNAIATGTFADGVIRDRAFVGVDQIYTLVLSFAYAISLIRFYRGTANYG